MAQFSNGFINLKNPEIINFLGLKQELVELLLNNKYQLYVDFDNDRAVVFSEEGNDLAHMTLKQLSRRTKI